MTRGFRRTAVTAAVAGVTAVCAAAAPSDTVLVSRPSGEDALADGSSYHTTISGDGRLVTFMSQARNLVQRDKNGEYDVFVRDVKDSTTIVASRANGERGASSNGRSAWPAISANGDFVAFQSLASNLVPGDRNAKSDVFVRDLRRATTQLVSRRTGASDRLGDDHAYDPAISADGRFVAFQSFASNMVAGDTNAKPDVFVRDRRRDTTSLVSRPARRTDVADGASDNPSISADGRFIAFESTASNLVAGDRNRASDVFVRDLAAGQTQLVSAVGRGAVRSGDGASYMPSISADGRFVAFASRADDLVPGDGHDEDVFVRDLRDGSTRVVSVRRSSAPQPSASARTIYPSISGDGRFVAFHSDAPNLVAGDSNGNGDVFVRDLVAGRTWIVSTTRDSTAASANGYSGGPSISSDGQFVAFASVATDLVGGDTNAEPDIFRGKVRRPDNG